MYRFISLGIALLAIFWLACNDNSSQPVNPGPRFVATSDYIFVDVSKPLIYRLELWHGTRQSTDVEYYIACEKVLIDRFTDRNGNGEYDAGVDSFAKTSDSLTNQDLNHNGIYDPPVDGWPDSSPPRFDDLNGNNEYNCGGEGTYFPGAPFIDANFDGKWEMNQPYLIGAGVWDTIHRAGRPAVLSILGAPIAFRFISDSGIAYIGSSGAAPPTLIIDSLGVYLGAEHYFLAARHGELPLDTTYVDSFSRNDSLFRLTRTVSYLDNFTTPDSAFKDVVHVTVSDVYINDTLKNCFWSESEAWFAKGRGLLCLAKTECYNGKAIWWTSDQVDSLPVPMIQ